ncbi:hypothetical protein AAFC00_007263 [Neodothiora populina]|uniref:Calcineurin-like phosphoesterase domain-containing protein n=1 Tax=Neodothiora populina TaxID=2781224 RepID=A0ABR3PHR4_9PEZI
MSYQYASSYPSSGLADGPISRITAMLGSLYSRDRYGNNKHQINLAHIIRRRILTIPTALILLWIWVLHWGERSAISDHVKACAWDQWEEWPAQARPHRVVMLADPQIVDPHTYPGRPWPLSSLTIAFTDLYLKRSYKQVHRTLDPDTLFFLGDLFDGGREWATDAQGFQVAEPRWKPYGESFWLAEYNRFGSIFFAPDQISGGRPAQKAKQIIASLPGNHDLGFGNGIQKPVRERFRAYFGEGDRIDVVGNHSFVSLDTVSLSAMGQPDADESIWRGTLDFLDQAQHLKSKALERVLNIENDKPLQTKFSHEVTFPLDVDDYERRLKNQKNQEASTPELPAVVLSHVPLYREPGTPCGPLREKYPPSAPDLEHDDANSIRVAAGYQYQNVLTHDISKLIAEKVSNVGYAFSGDDHDYCDTVHHEYASAGSGIREVTVKSMSWAMGVRHPGFQLVSLWNPVDEHGKSLQEAHGSQHAGAPTLQTHLCLLPDQLGIFIRYAMCAILSLVVLAVHAVVEARKGPAEDIKDEESGSPVLPVFEKLPSRREKSSSTRSRAASGSFHPTLSTQGNKGALSARSMNARTRSVSPMPGTNGTYGLPSYGYKAPLIEQAGYYGSDNVEIMDGDTDDWGNPYMKIKPPKSKGSVVRVSEGFGRRLVVVGAPVLIWYWWLLRN